MARWWHGRRRGCPLAHRGAVGSNLDRRVRPSSVTNWLVGKAPQEPRRVCSAWWPAADPRTAAREAGRVDAMGAEGSVV
jgi:hypothetical protein